MDRIDKLFDNLENACANRQGYILLEIRRILDAEKDFSDIEETGYAEEVKE